MPQMRIAKASVQDIEKTNDFLNICDAIWGKFGDGSDSWLSWDEDEEDYKLCKQIQGYLSEEGRYSPEEIDNDRVMFEFLRQRFGRCRCSYGKVIMAADVLIDNVCDPTLGHLEFLPGLELFHVAPEQ